MDATNIYQHARSDSLFAELTRRGLVAVFFEFFFGERPSPEDLLAWFKVRHFKRVSTGSIYNLISRHGLGYRIGQAREASDSMDGLLPADTDARIKRAVKARTLDLVVSEMGSKEALALEKMERSSELEAQKLKTRRQETAVRARLKLRDQRLSERRVRLLEAKEAEARKTLGDTALSPEEQTQRIKQIFGIAA